jgi:hypothetical protein
MTDESGAVGLVLPRDLTVLLLAGHPGLAVELLRRRGAEVAGGDSHDAAVSSGTAPVRSVLLASRANERPREQSGNIGRLGWEQD